MSAGSTFTAAMVQMRTGLLPEPSLEQGMKLVREAAAQGADYVLTPEVSNMMQLNRKALFEHLAAHGAVTETEAVSMLGSQRALRRFSAQFEAFAAKAPFTVRIDVIGGVKRYVREGGNR